jgi:peptidyl-tRNA hydrolase
MASIDQKFGLNLPGDEIADAGTLRLGSGTITAGFPAPRQAKAAGQVKAPMAVEFPQLRLPTSEIADSGVVRLGSGTITANFPVGSART